MANSLLDFVMSLVRDPDAAARYAADPARAIADAHLTDVTSVDVSNLIPMVSDSLSMTGPAIAAGGLGEHSGGNVWASGAATAAFDAFDAHPTDPLFDSFHQSAGNVVEPSDHPVAPALDAIADTAVHHVDTGIDDVSAQLDPPVIDDQPHEATWPVDVVDHAVADVQHIDDGTAGFDIFG